MRKSGYERHEVIGKWFGRFIGSEYVKKFKNNFTVIMNRMEVLTVNLEMIQRNGSTINVTIDCRAAHDSNGDFQQLTVYL